MDAKAVQMNIRTPNELADALDTWRASQRPILNRSEAIRILVQKGLQSDTRPNGNGAA